MFALRERERERERDSCIAGTCQPICLLCLQGAMDFDRQAKISRKMQKGDFDFDDFLQQVVMVVVVVVGI